MLNKKWLSVSVTLVMIFLVIGALTFVSVMLTPDAQSKRALGVSNFDSIHLDDSNATAVPNFLANQRGAGVIAEFRDASTPVARIPNGGGFDLVSGNLTVSSGILNLAPATYALTGTQTLTPSVTFYQVTPSEEVTITLATGSANDGDLLVLHNTVATTTNIVDTGATAGGGALALGLDDIAGFIFTDGIWVELFSPDNS